MNRTTYIDKPPIMDAGRKRSLTTLLAGDQGAVTMMFAMCASLMIGSMCMALDTIDYERNQARMQMALDVATLSAGADLGHFGSITGNDLMQWQADAQAYFRANFPSGYAGITVPNADFSATVSGTPATGETINLAASGKMSLVAPLFLNNTSSPSGSGSTPPDSNNTATVSASNSALRIPQSMLELVMVLDNTGSMSDSADNDSRDGTKMAGLQLAATGLVQDLFAQDNTNYYVGLVPFASTVNVLGALPSGGTWLNPSFAYNQNNVGMSNWGGCTAEPRDANGYLYPKAYSPSDSLKFTPYYYNLPPAGLQVFNSSQCSASKSTTSKNLPLTVGNGMANQCSGYVGSYKGTGVGISYNDESGGFAGTKLTQNSDCIGQPVTFLTTDESTLTTAITRMKPLGSTVIPVGLLWGWRMLSSTWSGNASASGWVSDDPSLPKPEDTQALQRVMIVLTDGENQIGAAGSIPNDLYFNGLSGVATNSLAAPTVLRPDGTSLAFGQTDSAELPHGKNPIGDPIDTTSGNNAGYPDDVNAFQLAVCTAIKQSGVTVYAITFGASTGDATSVAQQTMQSCASPGDYYHAPTSATLNTIFQQIASNLGVLRLTK